MLKLTYKIKPEERTLPSDASRRRRRKRSASTSCAPRWDTHEPAPSRARWPSACGPSDDGERLVPSLIEEKLTRPERAAAAAVARTPLERAMSQAPRAASPELEPIPSARTERTDSRRRRRRSEPKHGPKRAAKRREPRRRERPRAKATTRPTATRSARVVVAAVVVAEAAASASVDERRAAAPRRMAETIDTSDGKEFWEAWVDSKSDAPAARRRRAQRDPRSERAAARARVASGAAAREGREPRARASARRRRSPRATCGST